MFYKMTISVKSFLKLECAALKQTRQKKSHKNTLSDAIFY